ncbi:g10357 [Coccomyxa elongata]
MTDSPPANLPIAVSPGDIASPEVREHKRVLEEAKAALTAYTAVPNFAIDGVEHLLQQVRSAREGYEAVKAAADANAAARRTPPPVAMPVLDEDRSTEQKIAQTAEHIKGWVDGGPKRPSASVFTGDNKRAKGPITLELINHRTGERRCSNCGRGQVEHKTIGKMGKECPRPFLPPTQAEQDAMKGKGQA